MPKNVKSVFFNDGKDADVFAVVVGKNPNGNLNLITFPTDSAVEHENDIPQGEGGRTWHS